MVSLYILNFHFPKFHLILFYVFPFFAYCVYVSYKFLSVFVTVLKSMAVNSIISVLSKSVLTDIFLSRFFLLHCRSGIFFFLIGCRTKVLGFHNLPLNRVEVGFGSQLSVLRVSLILLRFVLKLSASVYSGLCSAASVTRAFGISALWFPKRFSLNNLIEFYST